MPKRKQTGPNEGHMYYRTKTGKQHEESNSCWCDPTVMEIGGSTVTIHNGPKRGELVSFIVNKDTGERTQVWTSAT